MRNKQCIMGTLWSSILYGTHITWALNRCVFYKTSRGQIPLSQDKSITCVIDDLQVPCSVTPKCKIKSYRKKVIFIVFQPCWFCGLFTGKYPNNVKIWLFLVNRFITGFLVWRVPVTALFLFFLPLALRWHFGIVTFIISNGLVLISCQIITSN